MKLTMQRIKQTAARILPAVFVRHKIALLLGMVIVVALTLVGVSMALYSADGTAQLDLSRPGYRGVATRLDEEIRTFEEYPSSGSIDQRSLDEFEALFNRQVDRVTGVDAFSGDPLSPDALQLESDSSVDAVPKAQP